MTKRFQITLTGTIPKGMTLAQVRHAYWNGGFDGDSGQNFDTRLVEIDDYYDDARVRRPMRVRLGRATLLRGRR